MKISQIILVTKRPRSWTTINVAYNFHPWNAEMVQVMNIVAGTHNP